MTLDDILLKALEEGPVSVKDISKRVERRLRMKLDKLRARGLVLREGRGGVYREFTYRLLQRDLAARARQEDDLSRGDRASIGRPGTVWARQAKGRSSPIFPSKFVQRNAPSSPS
jgi:predicted ArsR family transcriptional regulator